MSPVAGWVLYMLVAVLLWATNVPVLSGLGQLLAVVGVGWFVVTLVKGKP